MRILREPEKRVKTLIFKNLRFAEVQASSLEIGKLAIVVGIISRRLVNGSYGNFHPIAPQVPYV